MYLAYLPRWRMGFWSLVNIKCLVFIYNVFIQNQYSIPITNIHHFLFFLFILKPEYLFLFIYQSFFTCCGLDYWILGQFTVSDKPTHRFRNTSNTDKILFFSLTSSTWRSIKVSNSYVLVTSAFKVLLSLFFAVLKNRISRSHPST